MQHEDEERHRRSGGIRKTKVSAWQFLKLCHLTRYFLVMECQTRPIRRWHSVECGTRIKTGDLCPGFAGFRPLSVLFAPWKRRHRELAYRAGPYYTRRGETPHLIVTVYFSLSFSLLVLL